MEIYEDCELGMKPKVKLHPEEQGLLENTQRYKYISEITIAEKNNIRNVIASVIGGNDELFVVLEEQDCIGIRSTIVQLLSDDNNASIDIFMVKIMKALKAAGYSVSNIFIDIDSKYKGKEFRCSPVPVKKEK